MYITKYVDPHLFENICRKLDVDPDQLVKDDCWVSEEFLEDFWSEFQAANPDPEVHYKLGEFTVSPEALHPVEFTVNATMPLPFLLFWGLAKQHRRYSLKSNFQVTRSRPGHFTYRVTPKSGKPASLGVCENTIGMLYGTRKFIPFDSLEVTHDKCMHEGADCCEFDISYSAISLWKARLIYSCVSLLSVMLLAYLTSICLGTHGLERLIWFKASIVSWSGVGLAVWFGSKYLTIHKHIAEYHEQESARVKELYEEKKISDQRYLETSLLKDLQTRLNMSQHPQEVLKSCLEELDKRFGYSRGIVMLVSADGKSLYTAAVNGFDQGTEQIYNLTLKYPADGDDSRFFANVLERGTSEAILDMNAYLKVIKPHIRDVVQYLGAKSLIVVPIQDKDTKYGLLVVGSLNEDQSLNKDDLQRIENIALALSAAFKNAKAFQNEQRTKKVLEQMLPSVSKLGFDKLVQSVGSFQPQRSYATIFFVDMRGFTSLSEGLDPERTTELTNIYMSYIHQRIVDFGGIIDNIIGDQVIAFWPAAQKQRTEHAKLGMLASIRMLGEIEQLDGQLSAKGFKPISFGIGLYTGPVLLTVLGSDHKMVFGPTGDSMCIASRLESMCKEHSSRTDTAKKAVLIVSDTTYKRANLNVSALHLDPFAVRGRSQKENAYFLDPDTCLKWLAANPGICSRTVEEIKRAA